MQSKIFEFKEIDSQKAIYLNLNGVDKLVRPYELFEVLSDCHSKRYLCKDVEAYFQIFPQDVWGYYFDYSSGYYSIKYNRIEFIESAIQALKDLCSYILRFEETSYKHLSVTHAERLMTGLESISVPRSYSQIFREDFVLEEFKFQFVEEYSCDTQFELFIGNRSYHSCLSDWSNDYDTIRHELEGLIINKGGLLHLHFEDSPNLVKIKKSQLFKREKGDVRLFKTEAGEEIVQVTFTPDSFVGGPIIVGWCDLKSVVKSIYMAFLKLFVTDENQYDSEYESCSWDDFRLCSYNKIQSNIVENYLLGIKDSVVRQRIVNTIDEMKQDFKKLQNTFVEM